MNSPLFSEIYRDCRTGNQELERRSPNMHDMMPSHEPKHNSRQDSFSQVKWMHENPSQLPLIPRASMSNILHQPPNISVTDNKRSDEDEKIHGPGPASMPFCLNQVSNLHEGDSDRTIHFSFDLADDIESHLETVARLKRWGHFEETKQYFAANLEHHLDLPLVLLEYCDLLLKQGSYNEFSSFVSSRWWDSDQKIKCLPLSDEETGPDLYELHYDLLRLRARIPFVGASAGDLEALKTLTFCNYLDKRATTMQRPHVPHGVGMPFDSTEVQIICHQLEIQSDVKREGMTYMTPFRPHCWPEIYKVLLMHDRVWELSDLLLAMFHSFGLAGTWNRLFGLKWEKTNQPGMAQCIDRFLKDWTLDEYDEATEMAILTVLVEMIHMLSQSFAVLPEGYAPLVKHCVQQADQCAANIKEFSPHLTNSRPYLRWILAKETISRQQKKSPSCKEQWKHRIQRSPGLFLNEGCLPIYIPIDTEIVGWPAPDPAFPSNENLQWALSVSKELLDYKTQAMLLKELICRAEDPRLLFDELDQLSELTQGDRIQLYSSCVSQYLLATDDSSCRKLLARLESAASKFEHDPIHDVCVATRWNGLMVQIALGRLVYKDTKVIQHNALLAETISDYLVESKTAIIVDINRSISYDEGRRSHRNHYWCDEDDPLDLAPHGLEMYRMRESTDLAPRERELRRKLDCFEYEEKVKAENAEIRKRPLKEYSKSSPDPLHKEILRAPRAAYKQIEGLTGQQGIKDSNMVESRQPEERAEQDTTHLTHEPEEIDNVGHTQVKQSHEFRKPYRYASVTEIEDEPTMSKIPDEHNSSPARLDRTRPQMPKRYHETGQSEQTSKQVDRVSVDYLIDEEDRSPEVIAEEQEEATSENESPSRAGSLVSSSRRTSQESGYRQPLMIEYSEGVLD